MSADRQRHRLLSPREDTPPPINTVVMRVFRTRVLVGISFVCVLRVYAETREEYHARLQTSLEEAFRSQEEATAWWLGFRHPAHGDHYRTCGQASDTDGAFPPHVAATVDDHFYVGSISKSFGATVHLKLIEEGAFALEDSVEKWVPDFAGQFPRYANDTVEELMSMHTIVPDFLNAKEGFMSAIRADPSQRYSPEELAAFAVQFYPHPDGTGYSTTNIEALDLIAETLTGDAMPDRVSNMVTQKLGLGETALPHRDAPQGVLPEPDTHAYLGPSCVKEFEDAGGVASVGDRDDARMDAIVSAGTGGAIYSTIRDLLRWARSGLGDDVLSKDSATTCSPRRVRHNATSSKQQMTSFRTDWASTGTFPAISPRASRATCHQTGTGTTATRSGRTRARTARTTGRGPLPRR